MKRYYNNKRLMVDGISVDVCMKNRLPRPDRVWNRIPDDIRDRLLRLALDEPELSSRELIVWFTDAERYFKWEKQY